MDSLTTCILNIAVYSFILQHSFFLRFTNNLLLFLVFVKIAIMRIEEEIKQGRQFESQYEKLVVNLMYTSSWVIDEQMKVFKPYGLTSPQYNVLRILRGQYPEVCTVNMIIDRMIDRMSNASRIVDRLELKNLVERTVCKTDRRAKDVLITEKGLALLEEVDVALENWLKKLQHISEEDVNDMNTCLDRLRTPKA